MTCNCFAARLSTDTHETGCPASPDRFLVQTSWQTEDGTWHDSTLGGAGMTWQSAHELLTNYVVTLCSHGARVDPFGSAGWRVTPDGDRTVEWVQTVRTGTETNRP